jgi:predicted Zn-dependent protease
MTQSDAELALILSHEIAHNLLGHRRQTAEKAAPGTLLDVAIGLTTGIHTHGAFARMVSEPYSKNFEREADYVGLYLAARAGFDISESANFWRRFSIENPASIERSYSNTHPSSPERFLAIENAVKEINNKKQLGMPLIPDIKIKPPANPSSSGDSESNSQR